MKHFGVSKIAVLLLMLSLPAVAKAPIITVNPFTPEVVPAGPDGCPFDMAVVPQPGRPNRGKIIEFADGSSILSGPVFVNVTNLSNSKSINLNISGPGQFSVSNNTFTLFGATLNFLPSTLVPPGLSPISFAHGLTVYQFDDSGNVISVSFKGEAENLCPMLQ